jgi:hypothetical protein
MFVDYMLSFYSSESDLYPEIDMQREEAILAEAILRSRVEDFVGDSVDREFARDIVLNEIRTGDYLCEMVVPYDDSDKISAEDFAAFVEEIQCIVEAA